VSSDFLRTLSVQSLDGRGFTEHDGANQPKVMLVNRALARSGFLGPSPLGARVFAGPSVFEVVGIVDDVHQYGLEQEPDPQVFFDIRQLPAGNPTPYFAVRTERESANLVSSIRGLVPQLDPCGIVDNVATMDAIVT